jgi:hypothetical protein
MPQVTEVPKFCAAPDHQARPPVEFSDTTASRAALATGLVGSEVEGTEELSLRAVLLRPSFPRADDQK